MRIKITQNKGLIDSVKRLEAYKRMRIIAILHSNGRRGVDELSSVTPHDSGKTAGSWSYKLSKTNKGYSIDWSNSNLVSGTPLVILLQYGHGTRGGTFVSGTDFINPATNLILERISKSIGKEVANV